MVIPTFKNFMKENMNEHQIIIKEGLFAYDIISETLCCTREGYNKLLNDYGFLFTTEERVFGENVDYNYFCCSASTLKDKFKKRSVVFLGDKLEFDDNYDIRKPSEFFNDEQSYQNALRPKTAKVPFYLLVAPKQRQEMFDILDRCGCGIDITNPELEQKVLKYIPAEDLYIYPR